jgi:hypothetical protein
LKDKGEEKMALEDLGGITFEDNSIATGSSAGWFSGLSTGLGSLAQGIGSIIGALNTPQTVTLPNGQLYIPGTQQTYTPTASAVAGQGSILMLGLLALAAILLLRK